MRKTARKTKGEEGATDPKFVSVLAQLVLPLAELVRGDLRELVHTLGMQAIATMLEQERTGALRRAVQARRIGRPRAQGRHRAV